MQNLAPRPDGDHQHNFPRAPSPLQKAVKPKNITFACNACRRRKSKCDGSTPCQQCSARQLDCVYEGRPGQTRMQALKTRVDLYDELFEKLKFSSAEDAAVLFGRLRDDAVPRALEDILKETGPRKVRPEESSPKTMQNKFSQEQCSPMSRGASPASASSSKRHPYYNLPSPESTTYTASSHLSAASATMTGSWELQRIKISQNLYSQLNSLKLAGGSPVDYAVFLALADILGHEALPTAAIAKSCIDAYLQSAGNFLQVWESDEIQSAFSSVYNYTESKPAKSKMDICLVASVSAVGAFYMHDDKGLYAEAGEVFYQIARSFLENVIEESRVKGARIAACLTICNMFRKQICAISYCQLAISLARKEGLNLNYPRDGTSIADFQSGRRLWRTLMSQQSWLAESLAFVPTSWNEDMQALDVVFETADASLTDLINGQMAKLAILKASIVADTSMINDITVLSIENIMEGLRSFYKQLPRQMELRHAFELSTEVRRSVYYCHIFYLGGIILVYRIIIDHLTRNQRSLNGQHMPPASITPYLEEGLFACRMSCRVLKLLWSEDGVYRRCWLTIFSAYVSCLALLHAIAQNHVESRLAATQDDLDSTAACLAILEWCGERDEVALHFHTTLKPFYRCLLDCANGARSAASDVSSYSSFSGEAMQSPNFSLHTVLQETSRLLSHPLDETLNIRQAASNYDCTNIGSGDDISHILQQLDIAYEDGQSTAKPPYHWGTNRDLPARLTDRFGINPVKQIPLQAYGRDGMDGKKENGMRHDGRPSTMEMEDGGGRGVKRTRFVA